VKQARKLIAGLMAAYMLTLVVLPCNDTCLSDQQQVSLTYQAAQDHHEHGNDFCSPLCTCSCCSTLITVVHECEFEIFVPLSESGFAFCKQSFFSSYSFDCWQPPRLA
jgi:hypothetical protein